MSPIAKYALFQGMKLENRRWPDNQIIKPPRWCSVDLRDGNQALPNPMTVEQKDALFQALVQCGFKEIEVGFPAASPTDFAFVRRLIEDHLIPDDVIIQVLCQCREDLIARTVEALRDAKRAILHIYNSTSPAQRRIVFGMSRDEIIDLAVKGAEWVKKYAANLPDTHVTLQYSPESFSSTETDFALEICEAVIGTWQPTPEDPMIINLPETVQMASPNHFADQVEWFCRHLDRPSTVVVCVHTHNDRGTGVASSELAMLAGAERVEGTMFGNGERTGNADIVTLALNMFANSVDPKLDFSDLPSLVEVYEHCTGLTVPERHPYAGELVFTAFSGSHQDAVRKGLRDRGQNPGGIWEVPYLHIDPGDVGRQYTEVIRVNGQSGKGGIAYLLEHDCGIYLPKSLLVDFSAKAGIIIDSFKREVAADELRQMFMDEYCKARPWELDRFTCVPKGSGLYRCSALVNTMVLTLSFSGRGNGPIDAFVKAISGKVAVRILSQSEHALGEGAEASAIAYVLVKFADDETRWGAGIDTNIDRASIKAIISAINRR